MLKKITVALCVAMTFALIMLSLSVPIFYAYGDSFEVYLHNPSSLAKITTAKSGEFIFLKNVQGESVRVKVEEFSLDEFFCEFNAEIKFVEQTHDLQIYYAYSPQIKYRKIVRGQTINIQVAIAKDRVTIGSPLIFGSF